MARVGFPSLEEQRRDPAAFKEGTETAKGLAPEHLVKLVRSQKQEAYASETRIRSAWKEWWNLWLNNVDFSDKEEWQTKLWIPKPFTAVEQATALIQRGLLESPDAFTIEGLDDRDKIIAARVWRPLIRYLLERAEFPNKFSDAAKMGFILGLAGYLKFRWVANAVPQLSGIQPGPDGRPVPIFKAGVRHALVVDFVQPWRVFRDPESEPRKNFSGTFLIHCEWKDRPVLRAMQAAGWDPTTVEELLQKKGKVGDTALVGHEEEEFEEFRRHWQRHEFRHSYLVNEAWTDILDENGDPVMPSALMVVSDDKILYGPSDNPLWATDMQTGRRKWPFLATAPLVHPSQFIGRGIVEQEAGLSRLFSNVFMLWADGLNWRVNPPTEIFQDALVDWEDLDHYPGKLWVKHTEKPALTPANMGQMNTNEVMAALEYIDRQRQNSNFVSDFVVGLPGSRAEITKGEVQIKTSQSLAIFEAMGRNLEVMGRDAVELAYNFAMQYMVDYSNPDIRRILGDEVTMILGNLSLPERIDQLQGAYDFRFTGVSQALHKAEQLQKVMQFATLMSSPIFAQAVQTPADILKVIADLLNITEHIRLNEAPPIIPGTGPTMPSATPEPPTAAGIIRSQGAGPEAPQAPPARGAEGSALVSEMGGMG